MSTAPAPSLYDPWKCMKHPEAEEGTPQVFFYNEQTNATSWYRPELHHFEHDDLKEDVMEVPRPGPHLLATPGEWFVFTAYAHELCVRQWLPNGVRVRTLFVTKNEFVPEEAEEIEIRAITACKNTGGSSDFTLGVVVHYIVSGGGVQTAATRLLKYFINKSNPEDGACDGDVEVVMSVLDNDVIAAESLDGTIFTAGNRGEIHAWSSDRVTDSLSMVLNAKRDFTARTQPSPNPVCVLTAADGHLIAGDTLGCIRVWKDGRQQCFPSAGIQCGEHKEGEITAIHVESDRLFVARHSTVYVLKWAEATIPLSQGMARSPLEPIVTMQLPEDDVVSPVRCFGGNAGRVISGQNDGSLAVWPAMENVEKEIYGDDGYEYDVGVLAPIERFMSFESGDVNVKFFAGGLWVCTPSSTVIRIWSSS